MWGNYRLQKGVITTINNDKIGLEKTYKVVSSKHKINAIDELVIIDIEKHNN